jgi:hypothetical protein
LNGKGAIAAVCGSVPIPLWAIHRQPGSFRSPGETLAKESVAEQPLGTREKITRSHRSILLDKYSLGTIEVLNCYSRRGFEWIKC